MRLQWNPPKIHRQIARHINRANYALDVHAGDVRYDGTRTPDRPWMTVTIEEFPILETFKENYERSGNINEAFELTMYDLQAKMEENIQDERWEWDRVTIRQSGQLVESPRNIVDTGHLLASQDLEFLP